ncbi:GPI ethanolamine phosphate transferase 3 [Oopsacas minuta]|uniref:GPI ethanolamine phosphate transferase 3 n=1 Tax=Oopsacas minuta TaxID=111878 RepID=A0AAV7KJN4_9METZ|nr:GPI ethanolamine phosphate transferase 3 [Oopsacas minuta]
MKSSFLFCTVPVIFVILPATGLLLFTSGFFLTRVAIEEKSNRSVPYLSNYPETDEINFEEFTRFNRVVILVIDALRYDFVKRITRDELAIDAEFKPYHNHMRTITNLIDNYPRQAKLYKFLADPPTNTMQRIKGLTTGSLPTFVDQTSNFNSPKITEDSIIHQIYRSGRKSLFVGDDTWIDLFPDTFAETYPYPSFNVRDLHTVDAGVIKHLPPFLERGDWSLLIGHFLGVDHVGHIYGPDHSSMKNKLTQLDGVINSVVNQISDDTLLVVLGDHGMTETGDHGGDTSDETDAALFLYSPNPIFPLLMPSPILNSPIISDSVSQKNIVPTISLLLGLPIPYSNLGALIPELFLNKENPLSSLSFLSRAMLTNCLQLWRCLTHYSLLTSDISSYDMEILRIKIDSITSSHQSSNFYEINNLIAFIEKCTEFLNHSEKICQSVWARFRIERMSIGFSILIFTALLQYYITTNLYQHDNIYLGDKILLYASISYVILGLLLLMSTELTYSIKIIMVSSCMVSMSFIIYRIITSRYLIYFRESVNLFSISSLVFSIISPISLFSNSFIIREDSRIEFMLQTYNLILLFKSLSIWYTQSRDKSHIITSLFNPCLLLSLMSLTRLFHACRPEQLPCDSSIFSLHLLNLAEKSFISAFLRILLSIILLIITVDLLSWKYQISNYKCYSISLTSLYVLIIIFWLTKLLPEPPIHSSLISYYYTFSPRIVYLIAIFLICISTWNLSKHNTDFSIHYSSLCLVVWLLSCLLVGDGMTSSLALLLLYQGILSKVVSYCGSLPLFFISHYFFLLCSQFYFAIGHQFTVHSIRYEAAFTGFHGDLPSFILAGFLIGINMFAPYICNICFLPLFLLTINNELKKDTSLLQISMTTWLHILCFANIQVLCTCAAAYIHRRHLMVWNVFAPRFVYESVIYYVLVVSIFVIFSIVYRASLQINVKGNLLIKRQ